MGECNLCGSEKFNLVKERLRDDTSRFRIFRCLACGHIQVLPQPTLQEDREFYDANAQDKNRGKELEYVNLKENNAYDTRRHVELIEELISGKECSIVDIGAGYGFFVSSLAEAGYSDVLGIEISRERRELGQKHTIVRMIDYDVLYPREKIGTFDCIVLFHVLEHMADPVGFLKAVRHLMRERAVLICEVPNADELLLETCPAYNDFYWIRSHLNYFTRKSLQRCFQQAGLRNVEFRFQQRYGLMNLCSWLSMGRPQIERPVFVLDERYGSVERNYRQMLESQGHSDTLIAVHRGS